MLRPSGTHDNERVPNEEIFNIEGETTDWCGVYNRVELLLSQFWVSFDAREKSVVRFVKLQFSANINRQLGGPPLTKTAKINCFELREEAIAKSSLDK